MTEQCFYTKFDYSELLCFYQGVVWMGGEASIPYFSAMRRRWEILGTSERAKDHFSDMASVDFHMIVGGLFEIKDPFFNKKPGVNKFGVGRDPRRYIVDLYVPFDVWNGKQVGDESISLFVADAFRDSFDLVLDKASKTPGRLYDREKTERAFSAFLEDLKE